MFDLLRLPMLGRMPGTRREMRGFREGREAQAIATLISIPDQMAMLTASKDVSVDTEISYKLFYRMMLVTQTKAPKPKTNTRPIFCRYGSCSCLKRGIGIAKIMISVVIFSAALENQKASLFMQWPEMLVFQNESTWMHMNTDPRMVQQP